MSGRGGAGNILEAANREASRDLETSRSEAANGESTSPIAQALQHERHKPVVAMSGRGGAGNTYNPAKLSITGQFSSDAAQAAIKDGSQGMKPMSGRGGAGNYVSAPQKASLETGGESSLDGRRAEALQWQASEDVEKGLQRPDRAYLGPKEREKEAPSPTTESIPRS